MFPQDDEISFSFTPEEADLIRIALGKMPHDDVQLIVAKMYETVRDHVFGQVGTRPTAPKKPRAKKSRLTQILTSKKVEKTADAPFGLKKDGTPKKRPGRAPKEA